MTGEKAVGYKLARSVSQRPGKKKDEAAGQLAAITGPRHAFAGLPMDRVQVMGIVNVTPDSFSDGGSILIQRTRLPMAAAWLQTGQRCWM